MDNKEKREPALRKRIRELEKENKMLREDIIKDLRKDTVKVPRDLRPIFDKAQKTVGKYFKELKTNPHHGTIEIGNERYILVRASAMSYDFLNTIRNLYADRGEDKALLFGRNFLFDIAHVIGMNDAKNFHKKMKLTDPISKLSAGPVHFAYSGWAFVDILPESNPSPDDNYFLKYHHPFSFEADSWMRAKKTANFPVCIMNAGYSSGWCEESFGIPLTAVEISCKAQGDDSCTFIMAPPHKIEDHIKHYISKTNIDVKKEVIYEIPTFFERKKIEETLKESEEKFRSLIQNTNDIISILEEDGILRYASPSMRNILGYYPEELEGKNIFDNVHPDDLPEVLKQFTIGIKNPGSIQNVEFRFRRKDDSWCYLEAIGNFLHKKSIIGGILVTSRDVTEKKLAEKKLRESLSEKEILLKEVHHRVKNNLQVISSLVSLQSSKIKDKKITDIFNEIKNRIQSMSLIYENLYRSKDLSHINFSEYITNLSKELIHSYQIHGNLVEIRFDVKKSLLGLDLAIPCGLIINELISNSLKYAFTENKKGILVVGLKEEKGSIELTISDNGVGLPEEKDFRNPKTLGLQLVILLVKQIKGTIDLCLNGGTKYTITFKK